MKICSTLKYTVREVRKRQNPRLMVIDVMPFLRAHYAGTDAWNPGDRDLNIRYNDNVPQQVGDEVECEIHYKLADGESTTLIVKLVVLKTTDEYLWLWNEFQKVGMIVQRI